MSDLHLFPLPDPVVQAAAPELSPDRRRTLVNRALLDQGRHPAGRWAIGVDAVVRQARVPHPIDRHHHIVDPRTGGGQR